MSPTRRIFPFGKKAAPRDQYPLMREWSGKGTRHSLEHEGRGINARRDGSFGVARLLTRPVEEDTRSPPSTRSRGGETLPARFSRDLRSPIDPQGGPG